MYELDQPRRSTEIGTRPGRFSNLRSIGSTPPVDSIGRPAVAGNQTHVIFGVATSNTFAPTAASPAIDCTIGFTYEKSTKRLSFAAKVGTFPAYVAYAQLGSGSLITVFRAGRQTDTAWGLYGFGTGLNIRRITGEVLI